MSRAVVIANFVQACCWLVEQAPAPGETLRATGFHTEPGGKGLNVAVALQRLGVRTTPVLAHGQDAAGEQLLQLLAQEGLERQHVHALNMASGWGAGFIEANGQNRIAVFPGANDHLSRAHVQGAQHAIEQAAFVYAQLETSLDAADEAMQRGHRAGCPTVLNPSPWQALTPSLREHVSTYIVNASEASQLLGYPLCEPAAGQSIEPLLQAITPSLTHFWRSHAGAQELVLTLGEWGSLGWQRTSDEAMPVALTEATHGVKVVDTVGCGDAFAAAYCWARYTQGATPSQALRVGNACGTHMAAHAGVLTALPHASHVLALGLLPKQ